MGTVLLGIGELASSNSADTTIKTLGLGSCVAVVMLCPKTKTAGMAHIALPDSKVSNKADIRKLPGRFADTAVPALLKAMEKNGADDLQSMIVKLVGGASIMDTNSIFNIGKRNVLAVKKALWQRGMGALSEDLGGHLSRSVTIDLSNGRVNVFSPGRGQWKI